MDQDTDIGGSQARFPLTRQSAVRAARSDDAQERERATSALVAAYWKPAYKYVRIRWQAANEEAKDLTQGFFVSAIERGLFARYDPARAAFRTYLRRCLDSYVANERKAAQRLKRGGDRQVRSLDFDAAEHELQRQGRDDSANMDAYFHREWVRSLFALAIDDLRAECAASDRMLQFRLFDRYDVQRDDAASQPTYAQLADEFGIPATQVTNYLAWARREFRARLLDRLRQMTGNEAEFREEVRQLLGREPA